MFEFNGKQWFARQPRVMRGSIPDFGVPEIGGQ